MILKICELVNILLSSMVAGMFYGPWLALTRSISTFEPEQFIMIVQRLNRNMEPVMTKLMPAALLSIIVVLFLSVHHQPTTFTLSLAGLALFIVALLVTVIVEVPIVMQIVTWTPATLPSNWQQLRDRWAGFHLVRILSGLAGFLLLTVAAIFT